MFVLLAHFRKKFGHAYLLSLDLITIDPDVLHLVRASLYRNERARDREAK